MTPAALAALDAEIAAENAAFETFLAVRGAQRAYEAFVDELEAVCKVHCDHAYLSDEESDHENSVHAGEGSLAYWQARLVSAKDAAGFRASEAGLDINILLGRVVF